MWSLHPAIRRVSPLAGEGAPLAPYGRLAKRSPEFRQRCDWGMAVGFDKKKEAALSRGFSRGVGGVVCCDVLAGGTKLSPRGEKSERRNGFLGVFLKCEILVSSLRA